MLLLRIQSQSAARTKRRIHHKQDFSQFSQFCQQTHIVFRFDCAVSTPRSRSLCFLSTKSMRPAFSRPFISTFFVPNWPLRMPLISLTFLDRNFCNVCVSTIVFRGFFSEETRVSLGKVWNRRYRSLQKKFGKNISHRIAKFLITPPEVLAFKKVALRILLRKKDRHIRRKFAKGFLFLHRSTPTELNNTIPNWYNKRRKVGDALHYEDFFRGIFSSDHVVQQPSSKPPH